MKPIPFPTKPKKVPKESELTAEIPVETEVIPADNEPTNLTKEEPVETELNKEEPEPTEPDKEVPDESKMDKPLPADKPLENCVKIGDELIELKPTKLRYLRNKMASGYNVFKTYPLHEVLLVAAGRIDETRDGDQLLFDFLVAAFDDPFFVKTHYDDMTADDVEQVLKIFGRLNHIDDRENERKNREAQEQAKR